MANHRIRPNTPGGREKEQAAAVRGTKVETMAGEIETDLNGLNAVADPAVRAILRNMLRRERRILRRIRSD